MTTPFSSFVPDEPGQAPDIQPKIPFEAVNYNDSKFLEEDPKLIDHMDNSREQYFREESRKNEKPKEITREEFAEITAANDRININFAVLIKNLNQISIDFDDCSENSFRHVNALMEILEGKKAPVGFPSLEPKRCFGKLLELTKTLSDKMQKAVKDMEKFKVETNQFKRNDEVLRNELIKRCQLSISSA